MFVLFFDDKNTLETDNIHELVFDYTKDPSFKWFSSELNKQFADAVIESSSSASISNKSQKQAIPIGLNKGDVVEANYKGRGEWKQGHISAINENNTFAIVYEDGEFELKAKEENIRPFSS